MRRIIERIVTVVTTTTWKISWETDPSQVQPGADLVSNEVSFPDILSETASGTEQAPAVHNAKEVDPPETVQISKTPADEM